MTLLSPRQFLLIWSCLLPLIAWAAWGTAAPPTAAALIGAGLFGWFLFEYVMHRWMFHSRPGWAPLRQMLFLMHGNHHAVPNDPLRNLMPPIASFPILAPVWLAALGCGGPAGSWFFLGFVFGYVFYDMTHYACHQWPMKGRLARVLKQHHLRHHHAGQPGNYAVTGIFWDRLLRSRIESSRRRAEVLAHAVVD